MNILSIDIGGSGVKGAVLGDKAAMLTERVRLETPQPCTPDALLETITQLVKPLPAFTHIAVGYPGVVRGGVIRTAANLDESLIGFNLVTGLQILLGYPTRVANDADMQGLAAIEGKGVEMVVTLGTGFGTSLFEDGRLGPHLELAHHPFRKGESYEQQLGNPARKEAGNSKWNSRLELAIATLRTLTHFDHLYLGGGNAKKVTLQLPSDVSIISNVEGIRGGYWLWNQRSQEE
ncbi:MAG: ROK family protein [Armatimonadetes bacterium]|nr:ROK family protein [Armatimonadota bacterium]